MGNGVVNQPPRLVAWDALEDAPQPEKVTVFERQDWPVVWLPDRTEPGVYREHQIKRRLGFR